MTTHHELLSKHDEQVRGSIAARLPGTWKPTWDGPVLHVATPNRHIAFGLDLDGLDVDELDALIARVRERAATDGRAVEWKTYGHDRADLTERLGRAGFVPEATETVVIGPASTLTGAGEVPEGVTIRATSEQGDLHRIAALQSEVWGADWSWLADDLRNRIDTAPDDTVVLVAEAGGAVVSAAWLVVVPGTEFGMLWGGSTLVPWRRKGIYRALVAHRARLAVERGLTYLMVDASADSGPILQRLGLHAVTTTTPWVWTPPT